MILTKKSIVNMVNASFILSLSVVSIQESMANTKTLPTINIGYENNGADPFMVTKALGLFQKMIPAHVHLKYFSSGPAAMSALASNSLQFMCGIGMPPYVEAAARGLPLGIIYNQERYMTGAGIVVRPSAHIKSVKDLSGKKIAIVVGSQSSFGLPTFLAAAGVPYSSVHQVNMSPEDMRIAYRTGDVDAAIVWNPVFTSLQKLGGVVLKTDKDLPRDATAYNLSVANIPWAKKHPQIAIDFVRAMNVGVNYTLDHPRKALELMAKESGTTVPEAKTEFAGYEIFTGKDQLTPNVLGEGVNSKYSATAKCALNTAYMLKKIGLINTSISDKRASTLVDSSFAAQATK
jgi:NitT/TauT family transport system substrate-binding protein/taurine transport system substrate-binding protein